MTLGIQHNTLHILATRQYCVMTEDDKGNSIRHSNQGWTVCISFLVISTRTATVAHIGKEENSNVLTLTHKNALWIQRVIRSKFSYRQPDRAAVKFNKPGRL